MYFTLGAALRARRALYLGVVRGSGGACNKSRAVRSPGARGLIAAFSYGFIKFHHYYSKLVRTSCGLRQMFINTKLTTSKREFNRELAHTLTPSPRERGSRNEVLRASSHRSVMSSKNLLLNTDAVDGLLTTTEAE